MCFVTIILLSLLTIAALVDIQQQKIPNMLTIPAMFFGIISHSYMIGINGLLFSTGGLILGIILLVLFYISGMMGAGDVKLMGAVGSIIGPEEVFQAFLLTAFAGGIYAIIVLVMHGQLVPFLKRVLQSLHASLVTRRLTLIANEGHSAPKLSYGLAIAIGTVISVFI